MTLGTDQLLGYHKARLILAVWVPTPHRIKADGDHRWRGGSCRAPPDRVVIVSGHIHTPKYLCVIHSLSPVATRRIGCDLLETWRGSLAQNIHLCSTTEFIDAFVHSRTADIVVVHYHLAVCEIRDALGPEPSVIEEEAR